jgi:hypothetical protein
LVEIGRDCSRLASRARATGRTNPRRGTDAVDDGGYSGIGLPPEASPDYLPARVFIPAMNRVLRGILYAAFGSIKPVRESAYAA